MTDPSKQASETMSAEERVALMRAKMTARQRMEEIAGPARECMRDLPVVDIESAIEAAEAHAAAAVAAERAKLRVEIDERHSLIEQRERMNFERDEARTALAAERAEREELRRQRDAYDTDYAALKAALAEAAKEREKWHDDFWARNRDANEFAAKLEKAERERDAYKLLASGQERLLAAYRTGTIRTPEKALDDIAKAKKTLALLGAGREGAETEGGA